VTQIVYKFNTNTNCSEAYLELRYPELSQITDNIHNKQQQNIWRRIGSMPA